MSAVANDPFRSNEDAFLGPVARRSLVLVGHMPVMSGLWLSQFAHNETRRAPTVCLVRPQDGSVQIELFRGAPQRVAPRAQATLAEAIRTVSPFVDRWLVVAHGVGPTTIPDGATDVVILTGADEAASVAAYTLVKSVADASAAEARVEECGARPLLPVTVQVVGATPSETTTLRTSLTRTAQAFLGLDLPVAGDMQRVGPVDCAFRGTYDDADASVERIFELIGAAMRPGSASSGIASARPRALPEAQPHVLGDRFAPRRDRVPPRGRRPGDDGAEPDRAPGSEGSAVRPPSLPERGGIDPERSARLERREPPARQRPASISDSTSSSGSNSGSSSTSNPRAPRFETPRLENGLIPESDLEELLASLPIEPRPAASAVLPPTAAQPLPVDPTPIPSGPEPRRAPRAAVGGAPESASVERPSAARPSLAEVVEAVLPTPLAPCLGALELLPFKSPAAVEVELAVDPLGTLHLVARQAALARLLVARRWAIDHADLLVAACPGLAEPVEPVLHAVAGNGEPALDLDGVEVHRLSLVTVDGARGWLAQPVGASLAH